MPYATPAEALPNIEEAHQRVRDLFLPPPDIAVSDWAESNIYLRKGTTPRPGPLRLEKYQREMLDVFGDPMVHEVVCVKPTQIGWSVILNIIAGYIIDADPKPIMLVQPTSDNAKDYGRKRINPLIEDCPALKARIKVARSRKGGNTLKLKEFPGGFLKMAGANVATDLRSDPVPVVLMDEVEAYPDDVNGEGEPMEVAANRTESFPDFKILKGSTPAKPKGMSRLEREWEKSDQRRFRVPCPFCHHEQVLWWRDPETKEHRLVFDKDQEGRVIPASVRFVCAKCKAGVPERYKQQMLDGGRWVADHPGRPVVGFWLNALYRPWKEAWAALAQKWTEAQGDRERLKEFITLQAAEFWEEEGTGMEPKGLLARCEPYEADVPAGVALLTMAVDVQDNRLEAKIKGWGAGLESWLIEHAVFWGDPAAGGAEVPGSVWHELEEFRLKLWRHASGKLMRPVITLVDSGGHNTDAVYDFVTPRQNNRDRCYAIKGVDYHTKPVLVQEGTTKRSAVKLYTVATHMAKERIFSWLGKPQPGPGYLHLPEWTTEEYCAQLTGEKRITVTDKRTRVRKTIWVKTHRNNEALDLEVYSHAGIWIVQNLIDPATTRDLGALAAAVRGEVAMPAPRVRRVRSHGIG